MRLEQTQREATRLKTDINAWLTRRFDDDQEQRHQTQLRAIKTLLTETLESFEVGLCDMHRNQLTLPQGDFYHNCRVYDEALVWLRRVWEFFRDMFAQRDDDRLNSLLKAADDVIWSCYHYALWRAGQPKHGPAPLAFIAAEYSPAALASDVGLPAELKYKGENPVLKDVLEGLNLPVPILQLPPWCVAAPWWLVFVGHEVGHHVLHDLGWRKAFNDGLQKAIAETIDEKGLDSVTRRNGGIGAKKSSPISSLCWSWARRRCAPW